MQGDADGPAGIAEGLSQCNMADAPCFPLLELPDECLRAVLRCHAQEDPPRSLCSAARAHSRLHQAAVLALDSIVCSITGEQPQQQLESVLLYLSRRAQRISSLDLQHDVIGDNPMLIVKLPAGLQLSSLCLQGLQLQLLSDTSGGCGVLQAVGAQLSKLTLQGCVLLDDDVPASLAAGLQQLPELQHLSLAGVPVWVSHQDRLLLPADLLRQLQGLTFLELKHIETEPQMLQHLSLLTKLQDLRLDSVDGCSITAAMLAGMQQLTCIRLSGVYEGRDSMRLEPGALAAKPLLQHLSICALTMPSRPAGVTDLLAQLQQMAQLTWLELGHPLKPAAQSAAAYAALTASSALQHLELFQCDLPVGAWQHMAPPGKQLPQLRHLRLCAIQGEVFRPADVSRLASSCPSLQELGMPPFEGEPTQLLAPLRGLTGLQDLHVHRRGIDNAGLGVLVQLIGLTDLSTSVTNGATAAGLLQLTSLRQLRRMWVSGGQALLGTFGMTYFWGGGEPVCRQLLGWCISQGVPGAAEAQPGSDEEGVQE